MGVGRSLGKKGERGESMRQKPCCSTKFFCSSPFFRQCSKGIRSPAIPLVGGRQGGRLGGEGKESRGPALMRNDVARSCSR